MSILRGVSMADYLASPNVGHSKLKDFSLSPRLYFDKFVKHLIVLDDSDDQDAADIAKESRALALGKAYELLLTNPRAFDAAYICKPAMGPESNFSTKAGKEWRDSALATGKLILTTRELAALNNMRDSFLEHPKAPAMLLNTEEQVTFTCANGDITLQSRPDFVSFSGNALSEFRPYSIDLKTVDHMERFYSERAPLEYGYHRQASIARTCMEANGLPETVHYLLACEKSSPHRTELFELDAPLLDQAETWVVARTLELSACIAADEWPRSRTSGIKLMMKPKWLQDEEL